MEKFQAPRGTFDVYPNAAEPWQRSHSWVEIEAEFRKHVALYGYGDIRTPIFEETEVFTRSAGDTSEVVTKQMYTFKDKGDREMTLRPEGTAGYVRAVIDHNLCPPGSTVRLAYFTPIFRYERPQKFRYRQAHQLGVELLGSTSPAADAEVIELTVRFYERLGLKGITVLLNSIGRDECRAAYRDVILKKAESYLKDQEAEDRARMERNPLRLLDSKDPALQQLLSDIPPITNYLEETGKQQFEEVQALLSAAGVAFTLAPQIVRGLDYYTDTVFEVQSNQLGAQASLCGGGRYDDLFKRMGGQQTPAVGMALGVERALGVLQEQELLSEAPKLDLFVVYTEATKAAAFLLTRAMRAEGFACQTDLDSRSLRAQFRLADKSGARLALILGEDEAAKGVVKLRDLASGDEKDVAREAVGDAVRQSLK
ncbi:MAG: histidine--tRNA ligase [Armatimonadetes bacterium]|nr:histidine--tRNA ligase [Armatimonadota bacterium]